MLNKSIFYLLYYAINELRMRTNVEQNLFQMRLRLAIGLYFLEKRAYIKYIIESVYRKSMLINDLHSTFIA